MNRCLSHMLALAVLLVGVGSAAVAQTPAGTERGLIPPPAISIPYGGRIMMEANLSDDDLLGVIKQIIPAVGDVVQGLSAVTPMGGKDAMAMSMASGLDFKGFSEAVSGIKNVRVLVVKYWRNMPPKELMGQFDAGVAKIGMFSKVLGLNEPTPALIALYAEPQNAGYIGYAYDTRQRTLYAARVVGFVDAAKLTKWVTDSVKMFTGGIMKMGTPTASEPPATPEPPTTEPALEPPSKAPTPEAEN